MEGMWSLDAPAWTIVLRALIVYGVLLLLIRLSGKRTVGQFTPFDLVVLILIGESAQNGLIGDDHSIFGALIAAATLILTNYVIGWMSARFPKVDRLMEGSPQLLAHNGAVLPEALKQNHVSEADFQQAMREARCGPAELSTAVLETDGRITVMKKGQSVPLSGVPS